MRDRHSTRSTVLGGLLSAMCVALLYLSGISETASLSVLAVAGLFVTAGMIECGFAGSVLILAVSSLLGFLIAPDKLNVLMFLLLFGSYPIVKSLAETKVKGRIPEYLIKFGFCNIAVVMIVLACLLLTVDVGILAAMNKWWWVLLWLVGNAFFLLYDVALSRLILVYLYRIRPKLGLK